MKQEKSLAITRKDYARLSEIYAKNCGRRGPVICSVCKERTTCTRK